MIRCFGSCVVALSLVVIALGTGIIDTDDHLNSVGMVCFGVFLLLLGGMTCLKRRLGIVLLGVLFLPCAVLFLGEGIFYCVPQDNLLGLGTAVSMTVLCISPVAIAIIAWKEFDSWI